MKQVLLYIAITKVLLAINQPKHKQPTANSYPWKKQCFVKLKKQKIHWKLIIFELIIKVILPIVFITLIITVLSYFV